MRLISFFLFWVGIVLSIIISTMIAASEQEDVEMTLYINTLIILGLLCCCIIIDYHYTNVVLYQAAKRKKVIDRIKREKKKKERAGERFERHNTARMEKIRAA